MKKLISIYPGTFDPVTNGHLDVIQRAADLFDKVIVTIALNPSKTPLFTVEERKQMLVTELASLKNAEVDTFSGLLVDYASQKNANVIVRGLRAISDFEYEFQMSLTNRKLNPSVNTVFMMPSEKYSFLNSSLVRELASFNADIKDFVPENVYKKLKEKFSGK